MAKQRFSGKQFQNVQPMPCDGIGSIKSLPKPPMLIDEIIPRGALVMISGPSHVGKTFFAIEIMKALALKEPWGGYFSVPQSENALLIEQDAPKADAGRVIWSMVKNSYIDPLVWQQDSPTGVEQQPLEALNFLWHKGLNLFNGQDAAKIASTGRSCLFNMGYRTYLTPPQFDSHGDLLDPGGQEHLKSTRHGVGLIVYDSFRSLHTGDEDESGDMEAIVQELKWIREETGATQLILHHDNASGLRPRGSTAIEAGMDTIFRLKRAANSNVVTCTVAKARIVQPESFKYQIISTEDEDGQITKSVKFLETIEAKEENEVPNNVVDSGALFLYIQSNQGCSRDDLKTWTALNGKSDATLTRWVNKLVAAGSLRVERDSTGARYWAK